MKKVYCLIGVLLFVFIGAAFASDVADVAKKEKERRAKTKATKTFTNQDVDEFKKKNNIKDDNTAQTEPSDQATAESDQTQASDDTHSEQYWRNRHKELADKVAELQKQFDDVQSNLNQLQSSMAASGGSQLAGDPQGEEFRAQMAKRDELKQQLADAKADLDNLEDEARKAGVPPGWVRD